MHLREQPCANKQMGNTIGTPDFCTLDEILMYEPTGQEDRKTFEAQLYPLLYAKYNDTGVFTDQVKCVEDMSCLCTPGFAFMAPGYFIKRIEQDHQPHTSAIYNDLSRLTAIVNAIRSNKPLSTKDDSKKLHPNSIVNQMITGGMFGMVSGASQEAMQ